MPAIYIFLPLSLSLLMSSLFLFLNQSLFLFLNQSLFLSLLMFSLSFSLCSCPLSLFQYLSADVLSLSDFVLICSLSLSHSLSVSVFLISLCHSLYFLSFCLLIVLFCFNSLSLSFAFYVLLFFIVSISFFNFFSSNLLLLMCHTTICNLLHHINIVFHDFILVSPRGVKICIFHWNSLAPYLLL